MPEPISGGAQPDDARLIAAAGAGDRAAFEILVGRHAAAIFRLAKRLCADEAAAEDVLQETFLQAFRGAAGYRGDAPVRSWLYGIARHAAGRIHRKTPQVPTEEATLEELGMAAGWGTGLDAEAAAILSEDRARVSAALAALAPEDREVLVLRELEGLSGEETAAVVGLSLAALKSRLHRARLRFQAALVGAPGGEGGKDHAARS